MNDCIGYHCTQAAVNWSVQRRVVVSTQSFKYQYKYQYLSLKYQYQYPCLKYRYKYQYFGSKYQYQHKYLKMILKYKYHQYQYPVLQPWFSGSNCPRAWDELTQGMRADVQTMCRMNNNIRFTMKHINVTPRNATVS